MMSKQKKSLGRGLDALFSSNLLEKDDLESVKTLKIFELEPNKNQPRKDFDEKMLEELAESIKEYGVIQPILVRPGKLGIYQIVAGERRWRASQLAGLKEVPVIIKELDDLQMMEITLIENLQRENLNVIEEAWGYKALMDNYNFSQEEVAQKVGKSRSTIANTLRLLSLPENVIELVKTNQMSAGHARALIGIDDEEEIEKKVDEILEKKLSVRDVENSKKIDEKRIYIDETKSIEDVLECNKNFEVLYSNLKHKISSNLNRKVNIVNSGRVKKIEIEFFDEHDLQMLADMLSQIKSKE